jgi:uncharacterized repeat protein (TIGR01451 family)
VDTETVAVNGNGTYTTGFTLPSTGTVTGTYQWNATYSGDANNSTASDINNATEQVTVNTEADLVLTEEVSSAQQEDGSTDTYTFTIDNTGPSTATDVTVTDRFPGVTVVGPDTASQGTFDPASGIWTVGTLTNGAIATLTVTVRVDVLGHIINTAIAAADQFDPALSRLINTATLTGEMDPGDISKRFFLSGGASSDPMDLPAESVATGLNSVAPATTNADLARLLMPVPAVTPVVPTQTPAATVTPAPAVSNSALVNPSGATSTQLLIGAGLPDATTGLSPSLTDPLTDPANGALL